MSYDSSETLESFTTTTSMDLVVLPDLTERMSEVESDLFIPSLYSSAVSTTSGVSTFCLFKVYLTSTRTVRLRADFTGFFKSYLRAKDSSPFFKVVLEVLLSSSEKDLFKVATPGAPVAIVTGISSLLNRTLLFSSIYRSTLFLGFTVYQSVRS